MFGCCKKNRIEAHVADKSLVVSMPNAETPRVWRADLSHLVSSFFEVREAQGKHRLVMKAGASEEEIAVFGDKNAAAEALQAITAALTGGAACARPRAGGGFFRKLFKFLLWLAGIFALVVLLAMIFGPKPAGISPAATAVKPGVPVPAEQIFEGQ